jgi:hypothetical protein
MFNEILTVISFVSGLIAGVALTAYGFKLGFKASYQIRETISGEEMPDKLLTNRKDPAEFDLLPPEEPE